MVHDLAKFTTRPNSPQHTSTHTTSRRTDSVHFVRSTILYILTFAYVNLIHIKKTDQFLLDKFSALSWGSGCSPALLPRYKYTIIIKFVCAALTKL